jgi:hypothetical protein
MTVLLAPRVNRSARRHLPKLVALAALALGLAGIEAPNADACGAFFRPQAMKRAPSLSFERVLIIHDPATETQHFIREVAFKGGQETFGFVVPTPSKPEVFKVKTSPFDKLEASFPFAPPRQRGDGSKGGGGPPGSAGNAAPKVVILDIKRVGSFVAFVLKATDASALDKWLKDNKLGSTPENDKWLAEYVARDFYYVAFRYEPQKDANVDGSLKAETVRISFKTPVPFYPYREPTHPAGGEETKQRAVALWLVSPQALAPVAMTKEGGRDTWVNPFAEGWRRDQIPGSLIANALSDDDKKLVDETKKYFVQPLEDQKTKRTDYGDVVFLPEEGVPAASREKVSQLVTKLIAPGVVVRGGAK